MSAVGTVADAPPAAERGRSRPRALLIAGAASRLGRRLAARLETEPLFGRIVGVDFVRPGDAPGRLETLPFDPLGGDWASLLRAERVDAIAHLLWLPDALDPAAAYRVNVEGTARLVAATAEVGVRAFLFRGSTAVYGARAGNPSFIRETALAPGGGAAARHLRDAEGILKGVVSRRPDLEVGILRLAPLVGCGAESALATYLDPSGPRLVPVALGYDPRIQLIHEDDAVEALAQAVLARFSGEVNVAAPGAPPLRRILRLLGRTAVPVPHPLLGAALALHAAAAGVPHRLLDPDWLRFPPVADLRRMGAALRFRPQRDALAAVMALAGGERAAAAPAGASPPGEPTGAAGPPGGSGQAADGRGTESARLRAMLARARAGGRS